MFENAMTAVATEERAAAIAVAEKAKEGAADDERALMTPSSRLTSTRRPTRSWIRFTPSRAM